jgi:hypothetical protein
MHFTLIACNKKGDDNAEIQLWYYDYGPGYGYSESVETLVIEIKKFCENNNIPLNVVKYNEKALAYKDYVLKRNIAAANGNIIIIEDANDMWDLSKQHADYTKLENYDNIFEEYKDTFCVPIGIINNFSIINRKIIDYYGIKLEKSVITYDEFLDLKQKMKEKGAKFKMSFLEHIEKIDYFKNKHGLMCINENSEIFNNLEELKIALKSTIMEICDDLIDYNNGSNLLTNDLVPKDDNSYDYDVKRLKGNINDENSNMDLYQDAQYIALTANYYFKENYDLIANNILVAGSSGLRKSPCLYIHKKITNEKIWQLANFIISEQSYITISRDIHCFSPVFKGETIKAVLELDDNFKYIGPHKIAAEQGIEKSIKISNLIDEVNNMVILNKETRDLFAKYYFIDRNYSNEITKFIEDSVFKLSENNFNYKSEKISKILDDDINEFVKNFNIHNE